MTHPKHYQRLAIAWSVIILLLCTLPSKSLPQPPAIGLDKVVHFSLFAIWGWLWLRAHPRQWAWIVMSGIVFGCFTEIAQASLSQIFDIERSADWADALADSLGVGVGVGASLATRGLRK